jgi:hypothetical protein
LSCFDYFDEVELKIYGFDGKTGGGMGFVNGFCGKL